MIDFWVHAHRFLPACLLSLSLLVATLVEDHSEQRHIHCSHHAIHHGGHPSPGPPCAGWGCPPCTRRAATARAALPIPCILRSDERIRQMRGECYKILCAHSIDYGPIYLLWECRFCTRLHNGDTAPQSCPNSEIPRAKPGFVPINSRELSA